MSRSPWSTLIPTCVWLSAAVENSWLFFVGIVVLRGICVDVVWAKMHTRTRTLMQTRTNQISVYSSMQSGTHQAGEDAAERFNAQ